MSGLPGRGAWIRKRKPSRWRPLRSKISGLVFFPRMPDIIRLRTSGETTSAICHAQVERALRVLLRLDGLDEMRLNRLGHELYDRHNDGIAELPIELGVRHVFQYERLARPVEAHQA